MDKLINLEGMVQIIKVQLIILPASVFQALPYLKVTRLKAVKEV